MASLNHSVRRLHDFEPLEVEGQLPPSLRGTMIRTGPGLLERFGRRVGHPFDADGALTAVRFGDGRALGATRAVESPQFLAEERAGRFLFGTSASWPRRMLNTLTRQEQKSTGNTNVLAWQGRLLALMEVSKPIDIDPATLVTKTPSDLSVIRGAFSAHPHRVASLATTFNFGIRGQHLDLFALPDHGSARMLGSVELDRPLMVHDFIATERHLVFVLGPAMLVRWRAMFSIGDLSDYFAWQPERGTEIVVVPIDSPDKIQRFHVDPFWVWHFANAFEDDGRIVVDLCHHASFAAFEAPSDAKPSHGTPTLRRYVLDARRESFTGATQYSGPSEFPSVHPDRTGARQRFTWLQLFPTSEQAPGIARFDTDSGDVVRYAAPSAHLGSEPMFVSDGAGESDGWMLQLVCDPERDRSYVAVLDARAIEDGPVAKVWFRQAIPMTFHGTFIPTR